MSKETSQVDAIVGRQSAEKIKSRILESEMDLDKIIKDTLAIKSSISQHQRDIEAISKATRSNIDILKPENDLLEEEIHELSERLDSKHDLIMKFKSMMMKNDNVFGGISDEVRDFVEDYECTDYDEESGYDFHLRNQSIINEQFKDVVDKYRYFRNCNNNVMFLQRCKDLVEEVRKIKTEDNFLENNNIQRKLQKIQIEQTLKQSKLAQKLRELEEEKQNLLKTYEYMKKS